MTVQTSSPPPSKEASDAIRVLVAEDVDVNRELIRLMLEGRGYQIDDVKDGERAVEAITSAAPAYDVVLMDVEMPVMNGMEATRALRAMGGRFQDLPIIALTAYALSEQIDRCLAAGMTAHLAKPFTSETLCDAVTLWAKRPNGISNAMQDSVIAIAALVRRVGSKNIENLLRLLLTQLDAFTACSADDRRHLQAQAHTLRGSASLLGFKTLANASRTLETCCRMSQPVDTAVEDAKRLVVLVHEEITCLLSEGLKMGSEASAVA
jgi:CheY-like chemotaxis protein/HPt (histidine-containing phosphotransfer) domain-containing protein